jgi:DNA-binding LytR/AlgR family response regulator
MEKTHLHISEKGIVHNIPYCKIRRLQAQRSSCVIYLDECEVDFLLVPKDMKEVLEDELNNAERFVKIHRSHTINLEKVKHYHKSESKVELSNGELLPVSDGQRALFLEAFKQF